MAVSPFDGANRIRFKGSSDCGLAMVDCGFKSALRWNLSPDLMKTGAPPKAVLRIIKLSQ